MEVTAVREFSIKAKELNAKKKPICHWLEPSQLSQEIQVHIPKLKQAQNNLSPSILYHIPVCIQESTIPKDGRMHQQYLTPSELAL